MMTLSLYEIRLRILDTKNLIMGQAGRYPATSSPMGDKIKRRQQRPHPLNKVYAIGKDKGKGKEGRVG